MPSFKFASATGSGSSLIVTCSEQFAGKTITCTNGTKTYTRTCPSTSPYEVVFKGIAPGTWTVSGVVQGQTISTSVTITDFEAVLIIIPEGSTVIPTDDIQTWLYCAGIFDKSYTTISQVLSDASTLQALIASTNAVDYMARSTTWASSVTSNSSAMSYIGLNNYCADRLLADSTWLNAICNSTYFESVLNVKVPTMTSNTSPSGQAFCKDHYSTSDAWKAFDGNDNTPCESGSSGLPWWLGYKFTSAVCIKMFKMYYRPSPYYMAAFTLQGSNDNSNWTDLGSYTNSSASTLKTYISNNSNKYSYYRVNCTQGSGGAGVGAQTLQFYGRASS